MLEELIAEGLAITPKVEGLVGNSTVPLEVEAWASQAVTYLEKEFKGHTVTSEAQVAYKSLRVNTGAKHRQILGALMGVKPIHDKQNSFAKKIADLNK
ncbi:hypothetical protein J2Z22_001607 [Paenibacillus forsythiae]|uniref:Uncharacterized protein n=1 Tax=Paenibacillus forsythiae TaxID=365616 RepID=A0ABU3H5J5_9BACL|nr:hypothetical protein [Paenibacillus forsythiae]MDT3426087.1 hypothetical protein [Paenibacillus forsythiae]